MLCIPGVHYVVYPRCTLCRVSKVYTMLCIPGVHYAVYPRCILCCISQVNTMLCIPCVHYAVYPRCILCCISQVYTMLCIPGVYYAGGWLASYWRWSATTYGQFVYQFDCVFIKIQICVCHKAVAITRLEQAPG